MVCKPTEALSTDRSRGIRWLLLAAAGSLSCGLPSLEEATELLGEGTAGCAAGERCGPAPAGSVATWHRTGIELSISHDLVDDTERLLVSASHSPSPLCPATSGDVAVTVDGEDLPFVESFPENPCPVLAWSRTNDALPDGRRDSTVMTLSDDTGAIRMELGPVRTSRRPSLREATAVPGGQLVVDMPGEGTALQGLVAFIMPSDGSDEIGPLSFPGNEDGAATFSIPEETPVGEATLELRQAYAFIGAFCDTPTEQTTVLCAGALSVRSRHPLTVSEVAR